MTALKDEKEKILTAYRNRSKILFAYTSKGPVLDKIGSPVRAQNSWAAAFWAGYDGLTYGPRVPSRNTPIWAFYAAGRDIRKKGEIV